MSVADIFRSIAQILKDRLDPINTSLVNKGQTAAETYSDVPAKIDAIETGADVSGVTATVNDVVEGKVFVDAEGVEQTGTMVDQGAVNITLNTSTTSYTIPEGKHSGSGKVSITTQTKSATPSGYTQTITPDSGKVLSSVSVAAMPTGALSSPTISVSAGGVITATSGVSTAGNLSTSASKSNTYSMSTQDSKTVTPSTYTQTAVQSGIYTTGTVYVAGDSNLVPENIRADSSLFGVIGSLTEGQYTYVDCVSDTGVLTIQNFGRTDGRKPNRLMIFSCDQSSDANIIAALLILDGDSVSAMWYSPTYGHTMTFSNPNLISCYVNSADNALCMDILSSDSQSSFGNGRYHVIACWD